MKAGRMILALAASAVAIGAPLSALAEAPTVRGASCRALYLTKLREARDAAARGDQKTALASLEEAQSMLRLCTEDPSAAGGGAEAEAHVLGRTELRATNEAPAA